MADIGDQRSYFDAPTTPFKKVDGPAADETALIPRPVSRGPFLPATPPPKRGPFGRVPLKVVYLVGVSLTTIAAVVVPFLIFSGDGASDDPDARVAGTSTVPQDASASPSAVALPPVPAGKTLARLSGTPSVVIGIVYDTKNGISYPRLGEPWATVTQKPFTQAQRAGKATLPAALIGSAMVPGAAPKTPPNTPAGYRKLAVRAARWALTRQYPAGAQLAWTASQPLATGSGWTLGYKVTYTDAGAEKVAQALVSVVEVGKAKPAMLFASIPESGKKRWRDLNTLAEQVRRI